MIGHQAIRMHLPAGLGACFAEGGQEPLPVFVIEKNQLPTVAPIHHLVNRSCIFHA